MAVCSCHCVLHLMLQIAFLLDDTVDTRMCICIKKVLVFGTTLDTGDLHLYLVLQLTRHFCPATALQ